MTRKWLTVRHLVSPLPKFLQLTEGPGKVPDLFVPMTKYGNFGDCFVLQSKNNQHATIEIHFKITI